MTKLSIILPCYNEGATLHQLIEDYRKVFCNFEGMELIFVNNGSTDDTQNRLISEQAKPNLFRLKVVHVTKNIGYGHGILSGVGHAQGEFIGWSHADCQCSPQDVLLLYQEIQKHSQPQNCFGKGYRTNKRGGAAIFTKLHSLMTNLILGCHLKEINAQPKIFHRDFLKEFRHPPIGYELDIYACYKAIKKKLEFVTVEVYFHERKAGQSKWAYSLFSRIRFIIMNSFYLLKLRLLVDKI